MVVSNWKITYDPSGTPLVLVDFGSDIGEELEIPWGQSIQSSPRLRAAGMHYFGRGNVENGISFSAYKDHASDAAARNWMLEHVIALPPLVTKSLKIEIKGGNKYLLAEAAIRHATPRMDTSSPDVARTVTRYEITGGGWSLTA